VERGVRGRVFRLKLAELALLQRLGVHDAATAELAAALRVP
jgi:hypothetical protein